jgi:hypothetical protein
MGADVDCGETVGRVDGFGITKVGKYAMQSLRHNNGWLEASKSCDSYLEVTICLQNRTKNRN